jgi:Ca-activated chloride channel homolog
MKAVSKFSIFSLFLLGSLITFVAVFSLDLAHAQQPTQQPTQPPKQQQPQEEPEDEAGQVLKVGTKLVNVLFSVTDKQNRYINDLTKEDLTVFENGKQQEIFTFKKEFDLPLTMAIMVDVSGSEQYVLPQLKDAGAHFIDGVIKTGKDVAAIIKFEGEATLMQNLTSNKNRLRKGLEDVAFIR